MRSLFFVAAASFLAGTPTAETARVPTPHCSLENVASAEEIKEGWSVKPEQKVVDQRDSAPFEEGKGDWFVIRTTIILLQCSVYDDMGNYSLRSYMLPEIISHTKIHICRFAMDRKGAPATIRGAQLALGNVMKEPHGYQGCSPSLATH